MRMKSNCQSWQKENLMRRWRRIIIESTIMLEMNRKRKRFLILSQATMRQKKGKRCVSSKEEEEETRDSQEGCAVDQARTEAAGERAGGQSGGAAAAQEFAEEQDEGEQREEGGDGKSCALRGPHPLRVLRAADALILFSVWHGAQHSSLAQPQGP